MEYKYSSLYLKNNFIDIQCINFHYIFYNCDYMQYINYFLNNILIYIMNNYFNFNIKYN